MSNRDSKKSDLPTVNQIISEISKDSDLAVNFEEKFEEKFENLSFQKEIEYARLTGLQSHFKHKGGWSVFLGITLACMILFQFLLIFLVGIDVWDFEKYKWLLPALLIQNLGQVIGLSYVVVKSLFK